MTQSETHLHVFRCPRTQEHGNSSNIFWLTKPAKRVASAQLLNAPKVVDETLCQLRREKAGGNDIGRDVLRA